MIEKTFLFAGVAAKNEVYKARFANDSMRVKALEKDGQTDIRLIQLPEYMTKQQAVAFLKDLEMFDDDNAQQAFADFETGPAPTNGVKRVSASKRSANGDNLFTVAGVACKNGVYKARWANDAMRGKALEKDGQTDVRLTMLPEPMNKYDAVMFIMELELFEDIEAQQAFDDFLTTQVRPITIPKVALVEAAIIEEEEEVIEEDEEEVVDEFEVDENYDMTEEFMED